MDDFWQRLCDPKPFVPRFTWSGWEPGLVRLHNYSDIAIWLAYLAIPIVLFYFARRRREIPFRPLFVLFGLFIVSCGFTHFMGYYTFYTPIYRLDGLLKLVTALVSWLTVFVLLPVTPRALAMRSPDELEREILARTQAETELRAAHDTLEQRVVERTTEIQTLNQQLQRSMAETHHRVKNNLQVIAALVDMEIVRGEHTVSIDEMRRLGQHIRSLAVIHDLLTLRAKTDPGIDTLSVKEAMEKLLPILQDMSQTRTIRANIEDARLPVRLGSSLAGLVNELVSNAIKHGKGTIEISFHVPSGEAHLEVSDEGAGFPPDFDPMTAANTGLELVESLGRWDLGGNVRYENRPEGGACVIVVFPIRITDTE